MNAEHCKRITLSLAVGSLALIGLLLLMGGTAQIIRADYGDRYVAPGGSDLSACKEIIEPCRTIQHAIESADTHDTIWVAQGAYTSTSASVITVTKTVTLYAGWDGATEGVRDPETYPTILDGEGARRVIYISAGVSPTIDGFIITGGNASHAPVDRGRGGGICSNGATPIIANNVITNNVAYTGTGGEWVGWGGGIYLTEPEGTAVITGNRVLSNTAATAYAYCYGGGIHLPLAPLVRVVNNVVMSNTACISGSYGHGGGIRCSYSDGVTIDGNVIRHNVGHLTGVGGGGGVSLTGCDGAILSGNTLQDNRGAGDDSWSWGGAVEARFSKDLTIDANRILSNTAAWGGGFYLSSDTVFTMTNNIVAANEAERGGGIGFWTDGLNRPVTGTLVNNTFAANDRGTGNGQVAIYVDCGTGSVLDVSLVMTNNLIYSHTYGIYVAADSDVTLYNTLFYANSIVDTKGLGGITNIGPITGQDPLLDTDYHLLEDSPAINKGISVPWLSTDIDGDARPDWCFFDIGADEIVTGWSHCIYLPLVLKD